ncbi:hypothetical protein M7I_2295 [Glarea lozoyensis 74030]|uniref:MARVEL domain-containing protein n=1 Tax=Glarea lozoyensis (strain ATCC 74030 / MF5533) TaxID=1104152 RepID=H0EIE0_GLAL7|nr:hypothetical protein M7I_2295 [Glarea lozoyensis 74030]
MIVTLAARAFQALFSIVVLGLSIALLKGWGPFYSSEEFHKNGSPPAIHGYGAFCGGAALLVSIVGIVSCFFEALQGIVVLALDGIACLFVVAGGIAFAVKSGVGSCDVSNLEYFAKHLDIFQASPNKDYGQNEDKIVKKGLEDISAQPESEAGPLFESALENGSLNMINVK